MIKIYLFISLLLLPFMSKAQKITSPILLQMRDGKVYFDNVYALNASIKKANLYASAVKWFNGNGKTVTDANESTGVITGTYSTRINLGNTGNYYLIRALITITVYDATYEVKVYDVYEKPIKQDISNEYSKIEYRWWDFRRGKPWSTDDEPLLKGISAAINNVMDSLGNEMNK